MCVNLRNRLTGVVLGLMMWIGSGLVQAAEVVILMHGHVSGEDAWRRSGVTGELVAAGWEAGGRVVVTAPGQVEFRGKRPRGQRIYFLADLPSEAPVLVQAKALQEVILAIRKRRDVEPTTLVGHSAGGVVARTAMVQARDLAIDTLITIAAPHLGTDKAEVAGLVASTPLAMMAPMMGLDTLNRSKSLYDDLVHERPGSFLYGLNRQPHPKARYISVVRRDGFAWVGDQTVPSWSQDMSRVEALRELASPAVEIGSDHALTQQDGQELVRLLAKES